MHTEIRHQGYDLTSVSEPSEGSDVDPDVAPDAEASVASPSRLPAVVIVCVSTDPDPEFDETLASFVAQDYSNLSILVIDAGSEEPLASRVAELAPEAFLHRLQKNPGYSAAANQAMSLVTDAAFFMFCHDDVALDAHCVSALVEELFRSNAGIVSPKIVEWDDRRRLESVGRGSDRFGVQVDLVEPREFDQEQYDGVRDVFVAPSGAQLVRADLFRGLGGFDPDITFHNEDLDLCWRAHVAGARVVVVPGTIARHRGQHDGATGVAGGGSDDQRRRLLSRHRLRTVLVTSTRRSLLITLPIALALLVLEGVYSFIAGRRRQAAGAFGAIGWNFSRLSEIRRRRADLAESRQVGDAEIRSLQVGGSARVSGYFRDQFGARQDRLAGLVGSVRQSLNEESSAASANRVAVGLGALMTVLVLFGSRHLISRGVATVGQFPALPDTGVLASEWLGGWRSAGMGGAGNAPSIYLVYAVLQLLFFWGPGVLDLVLSVGPIVIGAIGMWRLTNTLGSHRAAAAATLAYLANPLISVAMGSGSWNALVVYGAAPYLIGSALRLEGVAPFGVTPQTAGPGVADRAFSIRLLRWGLLVAVLVMVAPLGMLIAVGTIGALAAASFLIARPAGIPRLATGLAAAVVVPVALHLPWAFDIVDRFDWAWFTGPESPDLGFDSLADLMRFSPSGSSTDIFVFGVLIAAAAGLLIARGARFDTAARGWLLALTFWAIVWAERRGFVPFAVPSAEVMLAPAGAGLALAVGATVRALEVDLARRRVAWRKFATAGVALAVAFAGIGFVRQSVDGRWTMPSQGFVSFTGLLADSYEGPARVLWIAAPEVAPLDTQESEGGVHYAVTNGGRPTVLARYVPGDYGINAEIGERLDLAAAGETAHLGRLLASYGVDLVVVVRQLAPAPYVGPSFDAGGGITSVLDRQLDLERVAGTVDLQVYRNDESRGPVVGLEGVDEMLDIEPLSQLDTDLTPAERVEAIIDGGSWEWVAGEATLMATDVLVAVPGDGWEATGEGVQASINDAGTLTLDTRAAEGAVGARYPTPGGRRLALFVQVLLVVGAVVIGQSQRERT